MQTSEKVSKFLLYLIEANSTLSNIINSFLNEGEDEIITADAIEGWFTGYFDLENGNLVSQVVEYVDWKFLVCCLRNKESTAFEADREIQGYSNSLNYGVHRWMCSNEGLDYYCISLAKSLVPKNYRGNLKIAAENLGRLLKQQYIAAYNFSDYKPQEPDLIQNQIFLLGIDLINWEEIAEFYIESTRK